MLARLSQSKNKYLYLLFSLFVISELIILPTDNFPLNDDWVYGKTLRDFFLGRNFDLITSNCTLWTQIMWGMLFTKTFGFSFAVLRLSTLVSSLIGVCLLYRLVERTTAQPLAAFIAAAALLFNPIYFNLSHTYMTDVNFSTLFIACCFFGQRFYETQKVWYMVALMLCALLLILIRQFGIIVPLCFTFSCLFLKERRWRYFALSVALSLLVFWGFKYYEHFIKLNGRGEYYPFSSKFSLVDASFWKMLWANFKFRYIHIVLHAMVYTMPLVTVSFIYLARTVKPVITLLAVGAGFFVAYQFFSELAFPLGNIFVNTGLGAETFYEWLNPEVRTALGPTYSATFAKIMVVVKYLSVCLSIATLVMALVHLKNRGTSLRVIFRADFVFLMGLIVSYAFLLMISETFFDRYNLPMIVLVILGLAMFSRSIEVKMRAAWLWLLPMIYISVFGTKDYFELNRTRWQAYNYLRYEEGIPNKRINAGYEVDCWNDGYFEVYYKASFVMDVDYLIQYTKVPEFKVYKTYEFQRYFPYKKDKIFIFVREQKNKPL